MCVCKTLIFNKFVGNILSNNYAVNGGAIKRFLGN